MGSRDSIRISPKHGVNPAIPVCWFCGSEKNEILLFGMLPKDREAPRRACFNREPCDNCQARMKQYVAAIEVKDGETGDNPERTGNVFWLRDAVIERAITPESLRDDILKKRCFFIEASTARQTGLHAALEEFKKSTLEKSKEATQQENDDAT